MLNDIQRARLAELVCIQLEQDPEIQKQGSQALNEAVLDTISGYDLLTDTELKIMVCQIFGA